MVFSKIKFNDEWDEMCPIFINSDNHKGYEHIGTGVLLSIENDFYLLTASHIIDFKYENNKELYIPTLKGFRIIEGELFHNPLIYREKQVNPREPRINDKIDFSYYKLNLNSIKKIGDYFKPLTENQIDTSINFSSEYLMDIKKGTRVSHVKDSIKEAKNKKYSDAEIEKMDNLKLDNTISFAGYPLTKTKYYDNQFKSEIVYYHGRMKNKDTYLLYEYNINTNILAEFGKYGAINSDFEFVNPPKPFGISGGGIYKLVKDGNGFDRKLIGIGHQHKKEEHLFIGTNIKHCLQLIKEGKLMPYEVHQRMNSMANILFEMDNHE